MKWTKRQKRVLEEVIVSCGHELCFLFVLSRYLGHLSLILFPRFRFEPGRVTFLVNIWLNYKPFNVDPFPETMISNLSKVDLLGDFTLFGNRKDDGKEEACSEGENLSASMKTISVIDGKAVIEEQQPINNGNSVNLVKMTWPMGSCEADERIEVPMPLDVIRSQGVTGSDVALTWKDGVVLTGTGA